MSYKESNLTLLSLFIIARIKIVVIVLLSLCSFLFLQQFVLAQGNDNAATVSSASPTAIGSSSQSNNLSFTIQTNGSNNTFLTYGNPESGFKIQYPSDWRDSQTGLKDNTNIVAFYSPLENLSDAFSEHVIVSLTEYSQNLTLSDYNNLVNSVISPPSVTVVESKPVTLTDGHPAQTIVFIPPPSGSTTNTLLKPEVMLIWTVKGNKVYTISYNADSANYSKYLPIVQKMVESFKIIE